MEQNTLLVVAETFEAAHIAANELLLDAVKEHETHSSFPRSNLPRLLEITEIDTVLFPDSPEGA